MIAQDIKSEEEFDFLNDLTNQQMRTNLTPLRDSLDIFRVIVNPCLENFNKVKQCSKFSEYRDSVLRAVMDPKQPTQCVSILLSTGDYSLLIDLLSKLCALDENTLSLIDELIRLITVDVLTGKEFSATPTAGRLKFRIRVRITVRIRIRVGVRIGAKMRVRVRDRLV
jgi:hypothetical protein